MKLRVFTAVVLFIYNLLFPIAFLCLLPGFVMRMLKRGKYRHKFGQRLGIYSKRVRQRILAREWVWVHAVSVGEVNVAMRLIDRWKLADSELHVVLSTTTSTGFSLACEKADDWVEVIYNPVDFWPTVGGALRLIRPKKLVLIEAEVWPNLVARAKARGAGVFLANARLSPRSESRFKAFRYFVRPVFSRLDAICVQNDEDVKIWEAIGIDPSRIKLTGGIKYDTEVVAYTPSREIENVSRMAAGPQPRPVLLGGSTFPGEELLLAQTFLKLRENFPNLFLIIVPRHVERTPDILRELHSTGLEIACRSKVNESVAGRQPDILLVDTTGELADWYHHATVVVIGKSFKAHGGQNPVEPIVAGKPVVTGPHMGNFQSLMRSLQKHEGILQVQGEDQLASAVAKLLEDTNLRDEMAKNATRALESHHGATQRTVNILVKR